MSYFEGDILMELKISKDSMTSCWIIVSYLGGEFLMELKLSKDSMTSC